MGSSVSIVERSSIQETLMSLRCTSHSPLHLSKTTSPSLNLMYPVALNQDVHNRRG